MGVFYHEETQKDTKRSKYIASTLKEAFSYCQSPGRRNLSSASIEEEFPISDLDEEQVVLSAIRNRAIEKQKNQLKPSLFLYVRKTIASDESDDDEEHDEIKEEEFLSVKSCFSCCPSSSSNSNAVVNNDEAFHSVRTNLSRCSSMNNEIEFSEFWKSSIIMEFCHCEGWPFGLCRKALLLPPLPKSPSESWLLSKIQKGSKDT